MSDKKHIDRLFQEKLKDFEAVPSSSVWENISSKLENSKKDRKVIPLWWKVAGIAAGFILLLTIGNMVLGSDSSPAEQNTTVDTNSNTDPNLNDNNNSQNQDDLIKLDDDTPVNDKVAEEKVDNQIESVENTNVNSEDKSSELTGNQEKNANKAVVSGKNDPTLIQNNKSEAIINNNRRLRDEVTDNTLKNKTENQENEDVLEKEKANSLIEGSINDTESTVAKIDNAKEEKATEEDLIKNETELNSGETDKVSLADAVEETKEEIAEDKEEPEEKRQRWSVLPNVAPVYFNSFGKGSAIDDQFINNSLSGEINLSYGLAGTYEISDKLSVRAGVNQLKLGYSTNDIIIYNNIEPTIEEKPLKNVALNSSSQNLSFLSANGINASQVPAIVADNISSSIDQKFGFIEVPMELEYKISDKKLDVSIIGGFSTLFLNQNEVYSSLQGQRVLLGEATNIKKTSFSANFGLGVKYEISEKLNLNLEPVLKYHLNTFSDTSGNFNPYFIGVYTGFSFKF